MPFNYSVTTVPVISDDLPERALAPRSNVNAAQRGRCLSGHLLLLRQARDRNQVS